MKPLIILAGPTAVGKTDLSIQLAKQINGAIISADSMQVYKYMDIGSAKIMPQEMQGIDHYLIDELLPSDEFNIVRFQQMAEDALQKIYAKGQIPIVAGPAFIFKHCYMMFHLPIRRVTVLFARR